MNTTTLQINYGAFELRRLYEKYITRALLLAGFIHIVAIGVYQLYSHFAVINDGKIILRIPVDITLQPPPLNPKREEISVNIRAAKNNPTIARGNPIPVPDAIINPEKTLATQEQMNESIGNIVGENTAHSVYEIPDNTVLNDAEPEAFIPGIEKYPVQINGIAPNYPEIARKAGVEGTVWVKLWITKEGKVKKVEIVKSDNTLFNEAALEAASKWTFTPGIMNNMPIAVWVTVPFKFQMPQ